MMKLSSKHIAVLVNVLLVCIAIRLIINTLSLTIDGLTISTGWVIRLAMQDCVLMVQVCNYFISNCK